jgi:Glycosyltransferase family 87
MTQWKQGVLALIVAGALLAALLVQFLHGAPGKRLDLVLEIGDFDAFYCAGLVARSGGDPYKLAPLAACQSDRVDTPGGIPYAQRGIDPAPLPTYDLALFAPFSLLGYRAAGLLWTALLAAALFGSAEVLRRVCAIPFWATLAILGTGDGISCLAYGQEQPLVTLALSAAALLLRAGRTSAAVAAASVSLIEPHVGLPVMLALFFWTRARLPVAVCAGFFVVVALAFGGLSLNAEYFGRVLPAHAFSEISYPIQYSLTALLSAFGASDTLALKLASAQYALTMAFAVAVAGPLGRRIGAPAIVLFPAACAVLGGTFIHLFQISSALPFALYVAGCVPEFAALGWASAALIALPWPGYGPQREYLILDAAIVTAAMLGTGSLRSKPLRATLAVATVFALYLLTGIAMKRIPSTPLRPLESPSVVAAAGFDPSLASTQWASELRTAPPAGVASPENLAGRAPTWAGLLLAFGACAAALRRPARPGDRTIPSV